MHCCGGVYSCTTCSSAVNRRPHSVSDTCEELSQLQLPRNPALIELLSMDLPGPKSKTYIHLWGPSMGPTRFCNLHSQSTPVAVLYSSTQAPSKRRVENVVKASAPPLAAELLAMRVEPASTAVVRASSATTPPRPPGTYGRHHIQRQKKIKNPNKLPQQRNTKETLPLWRRAATSVISQQ